MRIVKRKYLTETEINTFLRAARKTRNGVRDYCLAMMAYRHGFRVSELIDVRLEELHLDAGRLSVRRLKDGTDSEHPIEGDELRAIRAWLRERSSSRFAESRLLFLGERGPLTRQAINYLFAAIGRKAGFTFKVHPHMMRHSCGYKLINDSRSTRHVQVYLGHKDIRETEKYTALNAECFRDFFSRRPRR
ncbi:MAG: tyrosine-type recombinase/integrase [Blastocatellia bacterium]|nr:tyrosine-type recombinase/integrase [Blastocatellia bacterium]